MPEDSTSPVLTADENDPVDHVLPFMQGMTRTWNWIGYAFFAIAIAVGLIYIFAKPFGPNGRMMPGTTMQDISPIKSPFAMFSIFLHVFSVVSTFVWILVDIVDRRAKYIWLAPMIPCGAFGLHCVLFALYLGFGRQITVDSANNPHKSA